MEIKSIMHDATPSWNGFNYQGKVGIYVCLSMILDKLQSCDKDSGEFKQYLSEYAIQYEWIEDFSILQNDTYISHHQVKHKAGTAFSTHLDALITIRNRNKKILSSRDLNKYFIAENDADDNDETLDNKKQIKHIQFLIELGCLNEEGMLSPHWKENIDKSNDYYLCLFEFENFSQNAFDNAIVYFHTAENVSRPTKVISEYEEIKAYAHLRSDFEDKRELVDLQQLNIYIGEDGISLFDLVLSDADLERNTIDLVASILEKNHSTQQYSQFRDQDKDIYYSALLGLVDRHITERHASIRKKIKNGANLTEQKESIKFKDIFDIFSKVFHNIDKDYLGLLCQRKFNRSYNSKLENLYQTAISLESRGNMQKAQQISQYYENLKQYYEITLIPIYQGQFRKLVRELMPNVLNKDYLDLDFYHKLTESNLLDKVLFDFLCRVSKIPSYNPKVFYNGENKSYYASCIDLSDQDIDIENNNVLNFQDEMQKIVGNYQPNEHLLSANYFVVKSHNSNPFQNQTIFLPKIIDIPASSDQLQTITEHYVFLKDINIAVRELNDE